LDFPLSKLPPGDDLLIATWVVLLGWNATMNLDPDQLCPFLSSMSGSKETTKPMRAEISML